MNAPRLPHHRRFPDFKRRRDDEVEEAVIRTGIALLYVVGVLVLIYLAAFVAGTV